jgi:VanZ family protein
MTRRAGEASSRLPHALAVLYGCAIAYASLWPFGDWLAPLPGTPFWLFGPGTSRVPRADVLANALSYLPLGVLVALVPMHARFGRRVLVALVACAALSFAMETAQWYLPPRHANAIDFAANAAGALIGGAIGAFLAGSPLRAAGRDAHQRFALPGTIGDVGLALVAMWLFAQVNPAIPPFALTFDPDPVAALREVPLAGDVAATMIDAAQSAFQLLGIGLFAALLVRERSYAGGAVLLVVGAALLVKGVSAALLLKPAAIQTWLSPGILLGVAAGALLLLPAVMLPRPMQVALCAVALLSSLLTPLLTPDLLFAAPPLTIFNWRFGHLLSFNGLTRIILVGWPLAAAAWLFALAGRPGWGQALAETAERPREPDPL